MGNPKPLILRYRENPILFIEQVLKVKTWSGMRYIIDSVWNNQKTTVRASHGLGKTFTVACIAVTFLNLYKNSIVITTAPTSRQVRELLWKEIGAIYERELDIKLLGEMTTCNIRIAPEWKMIGFSTDYATNIEGFHSPNILWVLDEAKGLPGWVYDSIEGSLTGGHTRVVEISTTDGADQQCPFRKHHHTERRQWKTIHLSVFDSPFMAKEDYPEYGKYFHDILYKYGKPKEGTEWPVALNDKFQLSGPSWFESRKEAWEEYRKDLWETKVLGEFQTSSTENIIPLAWIESAIENKNVKQPKTIRQEYGLDVARYGDDQSVLFKRIGWDFTVAGSWGKKNTMETVGMVKSIVADGELVKVDVIGVGAGVYDRLAEIGQPTIGIESGAKAYNEEMYYNLKAELWFHVRELFERQYYEGNVMSIPDDPELIEDLSGMKYSFHSDGRLKVEKKADFKKRYGRSPDRGDAFVYCAAVFPEWNPA